MQITVVEIAVSVSTQWPSDPCNYRNIYFSIEILKVNVKRQRREKNQLCKKKTLIMHDQANISHLHFAKSVLISGVNYPT